MKTTFYIIGLLGFSAVMLSPTLPLEYPSEKVIKQRIDIQKKEEELNQVIDLIEYNLKKNKALLKDEASESGKNK